MSVKEQWQAAGLVTVLLPSGFRARGVIPGPTEIIMRRIVPFQLRQAVAAMAPKKMGDLNDTENSRLVEARRFQVCAFVREMAAPCGKDDEPKWEKAELSVEDLSVMPQMDVEALDDLIMGLATADMITGRSEVRLGFRDKESAERDALMEAADTVDGWADFREVDGGAAAGEAGANVGPEAEQHADDPQPTRGLRGGRRTAPTAGVRGDQS